MGMRNPGGPIGSKIWTTGGTSEDKLDVGPVNKTADTDWGAVDWKDLDVVIGVRENLGGNAGPGGSTFMTGQFEMPTNNIGGSPDPGGDDV